MEKKIDSINSIMQFENYNIVKLSFEKNTEISNESAEFNVNPQFLKQINIVDEHNFNIALGCKIISTEDYPFPFSFEVIIEGFFTINNIKDNEKIIEENAVAILFPYLRSTVSMLTLTANENALVLPTINIIKMFEELEKQ